MSFLLSRVTENAMRGYGTNRNNEIARMNSVAYSRRKAPGILRFKIPERPIHPTIVRGSLGRAVCWRDKLATDERRYNQPRSLSGRKIPAKSCNGRYTGG